MIMVALENEEENKTVFTKELKIKNEILNFIDNLDLKDKEKNKLKDYFQNIMTTNVELMKLISRL